MNFSGLSRRTALGKWSRKLLAAIPSETPMIILQGPLRGRRWLAGSSTHGCWLGSYEFDKQRVFAATIRPGQVVFDIGAHVGFYTLLSARLVGNRGQVWAFEPAARNLHYLRRHLQLNRVQNVQVVEAAVCNTTGSVAFADGPSASEGRISPDGTTCVTALRLDDFIMEAGVRPPDVLKIDVEGAELDVLQGALSLLTGHKPIIFLATHNATLHAQCCALLAASGYQLEGVGQAPDEVLAHA